MIKWSEKDDRLLKELYPNTDREILIDTFNRTWKAIRCRAAIFGIKRSPDLIKKENVKYTSKAVLEKYGVKYSTLLPSMQEKTRQTNLKRRGVEYPSQSKEVRNKVKETVQKRYGVDNVFQAAEIKEKITQAMVDTYGVTNPLKSTDIKEKTKQTNIKKYGVENPFQLTDRVKKGMLKKYGESSPARVKKSVEKKKKTCLERYGYEIPAKNPDVRKKLIKTLNTKEVKEKKHNALKNKKNFNISAEETNFLKFLLLMDPDIKIHQLHPIINQDIDFYSPLYDLWIQYDGAYWHGKEKSTLNGPQAESIERIKKNDKFQNDNIPNLLRFWSDDVSSAIKNGTILSLIEKKIKEKNSSISNIFVCHQYRKKMEHYTEDLNNLPFNPSSIKAIEFTLSTEALTQEVIDFIKKYEWLESIGVYPKWCFTARYKGILGGVVLINEPSAYSTLLGKDTPKYEALIQRGAAASWTPKNLSSRLIMFSCRWMANNTSKRIFVAYADPSAKERGIVYQACNFDFLGNNFGNSFLYIHPEINRTFTSHYLKRTSTFRHWCSNNSIDLKKEWFKENGFKNLKTIPEGIKNDWYLWIKKILSESEKIALNKKMKYAIVIPKDKKEKKLLESLKTYKKLPYNKNFVLTIPTIRNNNYKNNHGITADRKNNEKISYIINNHATKSRSELARDLNETERWVKRQVHRLAKEKKVVPKR